MTMSRLARKMLPFTSAVVVLVLLYVAWIFWSRHRDEREAEEKAAAREVASAQYTVDKYGGGRVKILAFSLNDGLIRRGKSTELCYGVSNAKTIKIEPPVGDIWPSMSHCVEVKPTANTQYTLTVADDAGHTETAQVAIKVQK